ncbi:universal stress protein [Sneathiella glossodoripedis]|uniref:universal stress protein n=1 Tax=Sneathiella glossodoripedis TaxID=418853 RepID=UPI00046F4700|nr:universal stress protein [Sneathiella glossodoripedis]
MSIKAILVPLNGSDKPCDANAVSSALNIAKRLNAAVDGLHVKRDPRTAAAFVGEGMTTAMIESVIELADKDVQNRCDTALSTFTDQCAAVGVPLVDAKDLQNLSTPAGRFVEISGNQEEFLPEYGRMFDLIVACKKTSSDNTQNELVINAAILETGRPVLVIDEPLGENFGDRIAVIWNGSVEASLAITQSLPLLQNATAVSLICAVDDLSEDIRPDDALRYLALHGVKAQSCIIKGGSGKSTAQALMDAAGKFEADFVVMGAYTKSRLRRLFFGAVTGEMLENCSLPTLLVH